ncbi:hypothetical protein A2U01_0013697 [Trifolium medium]|uniref:Transmembrane protein n=1 Tax=Trifolium medium TaxID=97028 RepID=A0A392N2N3_9FABA|nr:hypothetical protein [Trifolium medium]
MVVVVLVVVDGGDQRWFTIVGVDFKVVVGGWSKWWLVMIKPVVDNDRIVTRWWLDWLSKLDGAMIDDGWRSNMHRVVIEGGHSGGRWWLNCWLVVVGVVTVVVIM